MSTKDVLALNERLLKKGASKESFTLKDYDVKIKDLENQDEVLSTVKARLREAQQFRLPFEELWRRAFMAWMQKLDTKKEISWESKRYMPLILQQVETAVPVIYSSVFNGPHIWRFTGSTPRGRDAADALDKVIHWQASGPSRMAQKFDEMSFFSTLLGTGLLDTGWSTKTENRWMPEVVNEIDSSGAAIVNEDGSPKRVKIMQQKEVRVEDWPILRALNPLDVWIAPHSEMGDECEWFLERVETTLRRIRKAAGMGHIDAEAVEEWVKGLNGNIQSQDDDKGLWDSANVGLWDQWLASAGLDQRDGASSEDRLWDDQTIFLMEYRSKTERITIAPGDRIIGYSINPYIHQKTGLIIHHFIPIPGCPYGRGLGPVLLGHQELVNENINNYMDVARLALMAPVIVNRSSMNPLDKNTVWTPNKIIYARDVNNAIKRADVHTPDNLAMMLDSHLRRDAQVTTGYSDQSMGIESKTGQTATESNILQTNAQTRTYMHVERLRRTISLIGKMLVSLNQQFMTEPQVVAIAGEDGLDYHRVEPWEIVGEVEVAAVSSASRANPALRTQQLTAALQVFLPILQQGQMNPTVARLMRALLKSAEVEDVDLIIPKNVGKMRDALMENVALERGLSMPPSEFDQHALHLQMHSQRMAEIQETASPEIMKAFSDHIQQHAVLAQQMGMAAMAQGGGAPGNAPAQQDTQGTGGEGKQVATSLAAGVGSQGVPGASSPGPGAAPGRPI